MANNKAHALARDELIRVLTAYKGITTSNGEADGTTLIDSNLRDNPSISASAIPEKTILITSGDAIQEDKGAASFDNATGKITLQGTGFSAQIVAGTTYRILNFSSIDILGGPTGIFHEQASLPINQSVDLAEEAIISLAAANTRYILRKLTLKSADPTIANTITVRLYGYVLNVSTLLRSFIITNANFTTYFNLVDLFGVPEIAADYIRITLQGSAAGPYVVTGQYSYGKNNV